jgi:hypothetical protein
MQAPVHLAQEMGALLGRGEILLGTVQARTAGLGIAGWLKKSGAPALWRGC